MEADEVRTFLLEEHGVTIRDRADMPNKERTWFVGRGAREDEMGNETEVPYGSTSAPRLLAVVVLRLLSCVC